MARTLGRIRRGEHKGAFVRPCDDSMECPRFETVTGETVTIVAVTECGEVGRIFAVRDSEVTWLY